VTKRIALASVVLLGLAASALAAAGEYRTVEVESLRITIDSEWGQRTAPGYIPIRVELANLGEARVVEIVALGNRYFMRSRAGGWQGATNVRQTVRLARGDRIKFTMPLPAFADNENIRFEIHEGGRVLERFSYTSFQSRVSANDAAVLLVADPSSAFGKVAGSWPRPSGYSASPFVLVPGPPPTASVRGRPVAPPPLDFLLEPARLPTSWLGFTSVRAVIVGGNEWGQLSEAQKSALLTWTGSGGDLVIVDGDPGAVLPSQGRSLAATPYPKTRAYLFGRIHSPTLAEVTASGLAGTLSAADTLQDSNFGLPANRTSDWGVIAARGFRLPIPGVDGVPARSYLFILVLFSLLIGPANFWLLLRARRPVLLVLTTPIVSALFIVLLAGYVVAGEGFGVRARAATITMLDEVRKQAVTRASISLYAAGMTPAGGLRFPRDVAIFAIGPEGTGSRDEQTIDLSESQRFASGAIQARSPTNLEEIAFRSARERLGITPSADGVMVVNGLGGNVVALVYRQGGTLYTLSGPLPSGGKALLKTGAVRGTEIVPASLPLSVRLQHLFEHVPDGAYLAVLERSPFWDPGVPSVDERGSFHVVIGWPEGQPS